MEGERRLSSRLKRKPLSDCTNLQPSKLISQTLTKTPSFKPFNLAVINKRKQTPDINFDINVGINTSVKSHTSTGSNNSPDSVPSLPLTPIKRAGHRDCRKFGPSAVQIHRQDEQNRKDEGKSLAVTPVVKASVMMATRAEHISSTSASRYGGCVSKPPPVDDSKKNEQKRKKQGKMVIETPVITSAPLISHPPRISSSAASGNAPADINKGDEQKRKDKGKMVVETPIIRVSAPQVSHPQTSSSAASGNLYLPRLAAAYVQNLDVLTTKDKEKIIQRTPYVDASDPMTPSSIIMSSSAGSGTVGLEKSTDLSVYAQRRTSQRKKHAVGTVSLPLSCPHDKQKKKGVHFDESVDGLSGSHTDPHPRRKKKRSHDKSDDSMHAMPEDEVAKLKAYYADIDAFELPEEVASENEVE